MNAPKGATGLDGAVRMVSAASATLSWRTWCGLLLAPSAWLAMEGMGYYFTARSCDAPGGLRALVPAHPRVMLSILALVFLASAVGGLMLALESRRRARLEFRGARAAFLARAGVVGSAVFTGGIVLFAIPTLVLDICTQARW